MGLILWWIVEEIVTKQSTWWQIEKDTLATTLMEWAIVLLLVIGLNWWMGPLKIKEPKNYYTRKVLGLFFKLTPRRRYYSSQDKPTYYHATSNDVSGVEGICTMSSPLSLSLSLSLFLSLSDHRGGYFPR